MIYAIFLVIFITIPFMTSRELLHENAFILLNGGFEIKEAGLIFFIAYYCMKTGVIFFAFSAIADESKNIGRYLFIRTKNRSAWLSMKYLELGIYTLFYWLVIYALNFIVLFFAASINQYDMVYGLVSFVINCLNAMVFLFLANAAAQWIDGRLALLGTISLFFCSDLILHYAGKEVLPGFVFLPTFWGRYSFITKMGMTSMPVIVIVLFGIVINIFMIAMIIGINAKLLRKSDIF